MCSNKKVKQLLHIQLPNAPLRGKKLFAKIFEGRKKQTFFCPFEWLVRVLYPVFFRHNSLKLLSNLALKNLPIEVYTLKRINLALMMTES